MTIKYIGRIAGIEPASSPWQREILPFDYIRIFIVLDMRFYLYRDWPSIYSIRDNSKEMYIIDIVSQIKYLILLFILIKNSYFYYYIFFFSMYL